MAALSPKTVADPSDTQAAMATRAELPRTLMGGTTAMRAAGVKYLPKEKAESDEAYRTRVARTTLFNAFAKTIEDMTGKVFAKPIVLKEDVPKPLVEMAENIDNAGRHINVFARDTFHDALQTGVGYIFVDMPRRPEGLQPTVAAEKAAGIRPYLVYIPVERLIGWKSTTVAGAEVLTQIRIKECVTEPDGEFHTKEVEQIRVVEPGKWRTYRQRAEKPGEWIEYEDGVTSLDKITLVPVYTNRTGFMTGAPPLEKLAELNVAHWQSSSDQRNILHVARVPILFGAGFAEETTLTIGANAMMRSSAVDAKLSYVEHSGKAIGAGREDLKDLEFQMQAMGLQLLIPTPGGKTATGEIHDDVKENSPLAMMAAGLADALEAALGYMAEYASLGESGGEVEVNTDFGIMAGGADMTQLISAHTAGLLSRETVWAEMLRRDFLSDSFDPEVERERVEAEAAAALDAALAREPEPVA